MPMTINNSTGAAFAAALNSGDQAKIAEAWTDSMQAIADSVREDYQASAAGSDRAVLAQRGYRQLTAAENKFYQQLIEASKSATPKQAFATIIGSDEEDGLMPETILQDVYRDLEENHPLLSKIKMTYTAYAVKWVLNDHDSQAAAWGAINSTIAKEITSGFKVIDLKQNKLSCYVVLEKDMLTLGPTFLDAYVRRCLREAMATGLEYGVVKGTGKDMPIGLIKDIHEGVSVSSGVYPDKSAGYGKETVTDFTPANYGALVAKLAKTENGKQRVIKKLTLLCTPTDYYSKVMPATTVLNAAGVYVNNLFPVPTEVVQTTQLTDGQAVLFLPDYYNLFAGGERNNIIEYSDEYKFLEDQRVYKVKQYATGQAADNTCALLLDISNLDPAYLNVQLTGGSVNTTVSGKVQTEAVEAA